LIKATDRVVTVQEAVAPVALEYRPVPPRYWLLVVVFQVPVRLEDESDRSEVVRVTELAAVLPAASAAVSDHAVDAAGLA
jgi:hypothetical protein